MRGASLYFSECIRLLGALQLGWGPLQFVGMNVHEVPVSPRDNKNRHCMMATFCDENSRNKGADFGRMTKEEWRSPAIHHLQASAAFYWTLGDVMARLTTVQAVGGVSPSLSLVSVVDGQAQPTCTGSAGEPPRAGVPKPFCSPRGRLMA